jgi:hypothetical protein
MDWMMRDSSGWNSLYLFTYTTTHGTLKRGYTGIPILQIR